MKTLQDLAVAIGTPEGHDPVQDALDIITQKEQQIIHLTPFKTDHQTATDALAAIEQERVLFAAIEAERDELKALHDDMAAKVSSALHSGDPEKFVEIANLFLTPLKQRRIDALQAELAQLTA